MRSRPLEEAYSGSTAVSEAYFAKLLNLPYIAVMPRSTSRQKVADIDWFCGTCHFVGAAAEVYAAAQSDGHCLDQFNFAERATDWRGNSNIAESIFDQMELEEHLVPEWVVMSAGTGGTSATIGRYIRYRNLDTRLCVVGRGTTGVLRLLPDRRPKNDLCAGFPYRGNRTPTR